METCSTSTPNPADVSVSTRMSAGPPIALSVAAPSGATAYAQGRRYGADGDGYSIYLTDPEGTVVELKSGN